MRLATRDHTHMGRPPLRSRLLAASAIGAGSGALVGAVVGLLGASLITHQTDRLGSVADWVSGTAAAAALMIASRSFVEERRRSRSAEARVLDREERKQAELVAAWFESHVRIEDGDTWFDVVAMSVRNASELPIYEVFVGVSSGWGRDSSTIGQTFPVIPPGGSRTFEQATVLPDHLLGSSLPVITSFSDSGRRGWRRVPYGRLDRLDVADGDWRPNPTRVPPHSPQKRASDGRPACNIETVITEADRLSGVIEIEFLNPEISVAKVVVTWPDGTSVGSNVTLVRPGPGLERCSMAFPNNFPEAPAVVAGDYAMRCLGARPFSGEGAEELLATTTARLG